ncbi:MAG TPA: hypothetical protein VJ724_12715 [Tahibacter sp.]|nr:hypothetical protein [Tahibacter sp.]
MKHATTFRLCAGLLALAATGGVHASPFLRMSVAKIDYVDDAGHRVQARRDEDAIAQLVLTLDKGARVAVDVGKLAGVREPDLANLSLWFAQADGVDRYQLRVPFEVFGELDDAGYELVVAITGTQVESIAVKKRADPAGPPLACLDGACPKAP